MSLSKSGSMGTIIKGNRDLLTGKRKFRSDRGRLPQKIRRKNVPLFVESDIIYMEGWQSGIIWYNQAILFSRGGQIPLRMAG